jgi:large subunit ribosomal protein L14
VRVKKSHNKLTGFIIKFNQNAVVLVNKQGNIVGNRIIGPIPNKLSKNTLQKLAAISSIVL